MSRQEPENVELPAERVAPADGRASRWLSRTVLGIVAATFFSDLGHEMATAVLPLYVASLGLGPASLGLIEGLADFAVSFSKLAGGLVGHRLERKKPWAAAGYLVTALATSAIALGRGLASAVLFRAIAWIGRGFRGPLRDTLLADAVESTHFGRAYGLERAADMMGAVGGPLVATVLVALGVDIRWVLLGAGGPGILSAAAMLFLVRERPGVPRKAPGPSAARARFPRLFWLFLGAVLVFGLGDFSRTFLIFLAARNAGPASHGTISIAVLLYALHNGVSALAAYPVGHMGDRFPKLRILIVGYGLGAGCNLLLAVASGSLAGIVAAVFVSGVYIAIEETLEKAAAASLLPRELRSLGFGFLATANAVGDMVSSVGLGALLAAGRDPLGFGLAAFASALGAAWLAVVVRGASRRGLLPSAGTG